VLAAPSHRLKDRARFRSQAHRGDAGSGGSRVSDLPLVCPLQRRAQQMGLPPTLPRMRALLGISAP
jgi:hypothetical protein